MPNTQKHKIAHLLLAAGASTRMGQAKQLLPWKGQRLIRHAIQQIEEANLVRKIVVVLGANKELISPELLDLKIDTVYNPDWQEGMGTSIQTGIQYLVDDTNNWDGIMISLVDQPLVQAKHYVTLFHLWVDERQPIAAAQYQKVLGVPAIFDQSQFPKLLALQGQIGARKILMQSKGQVSSMEMPEAQFDLDTPEDYRKLLGRKPCTVI